MSLIKISHYAKSYISLLFFNLMNLYQKIVPIVIVLGVLGSCTQYSFPEREKKIYLEIKEDLFDELCNKEYNEGPFFDDMSCSEDIFSRKNNDWVEEL